MALPSKKYLFVLVVSSMLVTLRAGTCPDVCPCDATACRGCSYSVLLKDDLKVFRVSVCCNEDRPISSLTQKYVNKTLSEVVMSFPRTCTEQNFKFISPTLNTNSLRIVNTSFSRISVEVNPLNLHQLDLSSNRLRYISGGLFNKMTNLRKLLLSKNEIVDISEGSFSGLTKLESLDLSENNLTGFANVFTPLKNLQHLNLSNNKIELIHENYFNNWLLQHLDVSHNNLVSLAPGALQLLPNLARLLLTDNPRLGRTQLDAQLLVGTGRRLQQIDASRTGLFQVPEAFTHSVRFLSLVGNQISGIRCGDLDSYPLLQSLDFSDNKIVSVEDDSLGRLEMLLFLNLNKNLLSTVPKSLPDELKYLSINENLLRNLSKPDFKNLPNLRILMLKSNRIRYIEDHVFDDLLSLEMLDLSDNPVQSLSRSTFEGPLALRDLRLCSLNVSAPAQDGQFPLSAPESVQMLHLQASPGLAHQLLADSAALAAFSHLQYLDLRMNNLSVIRNDLLFYLAQLKTLRLHGNAINCSTELWLRDWMMFNASLSDGETCYYSTSESKADMTKYNCTFPETFTISESLPPVNLYSTEMINKLLRYYGYFNNKTEKSFSKRLSRKNNDTEMKINKTSLRKTETNALEKPKKSNPFANRIENAIATNDYLNDSAVAKALKSSKVLDQNRLQSDIDHRFLDIEPFLPTHTAKKNPLDDIKEVRSKNGLGKRLNTPVNGTASSVVAEANLTGNSSAPASGDKSEFSRYSWSRPSEGRLWLAAGACALLGLALALWASGRRRHRRRGAPSDGAAGPRVDQLEVASISGGVLW